MRGRQARRARSGVCIVLAGGRKREEKECVPARHCHKMITEPRSTAPTSFDALIELNRVEPEHVTR